jgi:hypothetical protein
MKQVQISVWVLKLYGDGDTWVEVFATEDEAKDRIYEDVKANWEYNFDDDSLDDYERDDAIDHYYEYTDHSYDLDREPVQFPMIYLQDQIAKAMGLVPNV